MKIITLLTDFGSFYPAQMKGAILRRTTNVTFVDVTHEVPPQDVRGGAFVLSASARHFPPGTIHLAVVDPGVGTERLGIVVESGGHLFVGPDNGLIMPAARTVGRPVAYKIDIQPDLPFGPSATFHGRDVFAPVAALLAEGLTPREVGPRVNPVDLDYGTPARVKGGLAAEVIYVDRFGNVVLNLTDIPDGNLGLRGRALKRVRTYAEASAIEPLITLGSHGYAELAVNQGSAADLFGLGPGDEIVLEEIHCSE